MGVVPFAAEAHANLSGMRNGSMCRSFVRCRFRREVFSAGLTGRNLGTQSNSARGTLYPMAISKTTEAPYEATPAIFRQPFCQNPALVYCRLCGCADLGTVASPRTARNTPETAFTAVPCRSLRSLGDDGRVAKGRINTLIVNSQVPNTPSVQLHPVWPKAA